MHLAALVSVSVTLGPWLPERARSRNTRRWREVHGDDGGGERGTGGARDFPRKEEGGGGESTANNLQ